MTRLTLRLWVDDIKLQSFDVAVFNRSLNNLEEVELSGSDTLQEFVIIDPSLVCTLRPHFGLAKIF